MNRRLNGLSLRFRPLAVELIARLAEDGIAVMIVQTLRTPEEHAANLAAGTSWTSHSKHLDGDAIDVVPYELYTAAPKGEKLAWNLPASQWERIGTIGELLGLRWGGRWKQKDYGHFEWQESIVAQTTSAAAALRKKV